MFFFTLFGGFFDLGVKRLKKKIAQYPGNIQPEQFQFCVRIVSRGLGIGYWGSCWLKLLIDGSTSGEVTFCGR